jgi:hypothetical protein
VVKNAKNALKPLIIKNGGVRWQLRLLRHPVYSEKINNLLRAEIG